MLDWKPSQQMLDWKPSQQMLDWKSSQQMLDWKPSQSLQSTLGLKQVAFYSEFHFIRHSTFKFIWDFKILESIKYV